MADNLDDALHVASFFEAYSELWHARFPKALRRGHWHILHQLRASGESGDGVQFSRVCGRVGDVFKMDSDTCRARINELEQQGLVLVEDKALRLSNFVTPSPQFIATYDAFCVDVANALVETLGDGADPIAPEAAGMTLNRTLDRAIGRAGEMWTSRVTALLKQTITSRPQREAVQRDLMTFAFWKIAMVAWIRSDVGVGDNSAYLRVEDFHFKLYDRLEISATTTKQYLQKMIQWGLLERLNASHGIRANQFAVRMRDSAFVAFAEMFAELHPELRKEAQALSSQFGTSLRQDKVVPIMRGAMRNV